MHEVYHAKQAYRADCQSVTDADGWVDYLTRGDWSHFIAVMAVAVLTMGVGVWAALDGAESDVYRRAAEIKAASYVHAGWER